MRTTKSLTSSKPLVSVIIVNYNAGKLLQKAVNSVINFPGVEVVVADNASKDNSFLDLSVLPKRSNLILIDNGANIGFGKAVNQAVKKASGKYIYLLNPDASLTKASLSRMVATAKKYNDRAIIAPRLENPDGTPQSSCFRPQTILNAIKEYWFGIKGAYEKYLPTGKNPQKVHVAAAAAWLVPISVWQELKGLNEKYFLYFEDLDMCDRAHKLGISVIYDPQAIVKHAHGVSSRTNPLVMKLFYQSAITYHGRFKKLIIDLIILSRNLFSPPFNMKKVLFLLIAFTFIAFLFLKGSTIITRGYLY
ncbi:MAG: glycosyltransferase family 2 protein [bacterium]